MEIERLDCHSNIWKSSNADHLARYTFVRSFVKDRRVLDVATGVGYGAAILGASGATSVDGIDISDAAIQSARRTFSSDKVKFYVDNCENIQVVNGPYDIICSFETIEHLMHPDRFLACVANLLSPDGIFFCSTPDRERTPPFVNGKPTNPFHINEWYLSEFCSLLEKHFRVEMNIQVKTHSYLARRDATNKLLADLHVIRYQPLYLIRRLYHWLIGTPPVSFSSFRDLTAAEVDHCPIFPAYLAPFYGESWCHFAICRKN